MPEITDQKTLENFIREFVYAEEKNPQLFRIEGEKTGETLVEEINIGNLKIPRYTNEFWTARQRQASSLHELSYRACFKPQLPRFFIQIFTDEGERVYDPFAGRGTTPLEAAILGREPVSNDINPLGEILARPRLNIPEIKKVEKRLDQIPLEREKRAEIDLSMFFHPETEGEIVSLKDWFRERKDTGKEDEVDRWIRMVATNRLTGHSPGFFSVYTLPPNQAVSAERQVKINEKRGQVPEYRATRNLILKKTKSLLRNLKLKEKEKINKVAPKALFLQNDARKTPEINDESVQLVVTSPPFLDVVQYSDDNWLRLWFNGFGREELKEKITALREVGQWTDFMQEVFKELFRILKPGGWVAFEVGEVKNGRVRLDEYIIPAGLREGFSCAGILVNLQDFTKTSNIWGINNTSGTNTNRIVLFQKL